MSQPPDSRHREPRPLRRASLTVLGVPILLLAALAPAAHAQQSGTLANLYSFTGGADGAGSIGGVVRDASGTLYGETTIGGSLSCTSKHAGTQGCGTVYSLNPTTGFKLLATFTGPNGADGMATLALSGTTLYGTTNFGGASDDGVVFSVHTDGTGFTVLHQFSGADGKNPYVNMLRVGRDGVIYGATLVGGARNDGVLFSITPGGTYTIIHTFTGGAKDANEPYSLLISPTGILVGSSELGGPSPKCGAGGCGAIYEYNPGSGVYSVPYFFVGAPAGSPLGGDIGSIGPGPTVYGNGYYDVYSLSLATGVVNLGYFADDNVAIGGGPLLAPSGAVIGVDGGGELSSGILYSAANGVVTTLAYFDSGIGADPLATPILLPNGSVIGTTYTSGLCGNCGDIWEFTQTPPPHRSPGHGKGQG